MSHRFAFLVLLCALVTGLAATFVACGDDDDDEGEEDTGDDDDADTGPDASLQDCVDAFMRLYGPEGCQTAMYDEATITDTICAPRQSAADSSSCVMAHYAENIDCINAVECGSETADADYAACEEAFQIAAGEC